MRKLQMFASLALVVLTAACGGKGPTGSTDGPIGGNVATVLTFIDGDTERPVSGANVNINGASIATNASGQIGADGLNNNTVLTITAQGYLTRVTKYRGENTLTLWPLSHGTTPEYFDKLLHQEFFRGNKLTRITSTGTVSILPAGGFVGNSRAMNNLEDSVSKINSYCATAGIPLQYRVVTSADSGIVFRIEMDASITVVGRTLWNPQDSEATIYRITGGTIKIRSMEALDTNPNTITHELGHSLGLGHSLESERSDVMGYFGAGTFTQKEILAGKMLYKRSPGTASPDNDTLP